MDKQINEVTRKVVKKMRDVCIKKADKLWDDYRLGGNLDQSVFLFSDLATIFSLIREQMEKDEIDEARNG